jgi:hypothetical protein
LGRDVVSARPPASTSLVAASLPISPIAANDRGDGNVVAQRVMAETVDYCPAAKHQVMHRNLSRVVLYRRHTI